MLGKFLRVEHLHLSASHVAENENSCDMTATISDQCIAVRRAAQWMQMRCPVTIPLFPVLCNQASGDVWSEDVMGALWQTMRTGLVTDRNLSNCAEKVVMASSLIPSPLLRMLPSFASHRNVSALCSL